MLLQIYNSSSSFESEINSRIILNRLVISILPIDILTEAILIGILIRSPTRSKKSQELLSNILPGVECTNYGSALTFKKTRNEDDDPIWIEKSEKRTLARNNLILFSNLKVFLSQRSPVCVRNVKIKWIGQNFLFFDEKVKNRTIKS